MGVAGIGPTFLGISPGKAHFFQLANPFKSTPTNYSNCFNLVCTTSRFALQFWIGTMLSSARLQYLVSSSLRQFDQCLIHVYIYIFIYYIYTVYYIVIYCIYYIYTRSSHTSWIYETPNINGPLIFSKVWQKSQVVTSNESLMSFSIILPASRKPHEHLQGQKGWWILVQALSTAYTDFIILIFFCILFFVYLAFV